MIARACIVVALLAAIAFGASGAALAADARKVLRIASPDIDTLDPQQYNDSPSFDVICALYEGLYEWDYLALPPRLAPVAAVALPEVTDGGRTWTIRVKHGIRFTDDPAFHGKPREVTAADYVYSLKRWLDPNLRRGGAPATADLIVGMRAAVDAARKAGGRFDYDRRVEGLREVDRYTLQLKLTEANYSVIEGFLTTRAVAREVIEAAGGDIRTRVVGTGPYRLKEWKRGSRVVLEANPYYRSVPFPSSDDPQHAALVKAMKGRSFPQIGVIDISVIEEEFPLVLEFDKGNLDYIVLRGEVANGLLADRRVKPEYAARGITRLVFPQPFLFSLYFNVNDPVAGGMTNERVALRRAIALGLDAQSIANVVYAGQAIPANQIVPPGVAGHDPSLPAAPRFDPVAARALLKRFGYIDRTGSGYRDGPDGRPLTLTLSLRSGTISREMQTLVRRNMDQIGVRMEFRVAPFQDLVKETETGQFQLMASGYGGLPSGYAELFQLDSHQPPTVNASRFSLPAYDREMERFFRSASGAAQTAAARRMFELAQAYVPIVPLVFRLENDFVQPWLEGFAPMRFETYWKYLDIDLAKRAPRADAVTPVNDGSRIR